jgi:hypothetical protein
VKTPKPSVTGLQQVALLFALLPFALAGCSEPATTRRPTVQGLDHIDWQSSDDTAAVLLGTIHGNGSRLVVHGSNVPRFPFALQVSTVGSDGTVGRLLWAYEMNLRHQETEARIQAGGTRAGTPPLFPFDPDEPLHASIQLNATVENVVVAWANIPGGIQVLLENGTVTGQPQPTPLSAVFAELTVSGDDSTYVYTSAGQVAESQLGGLVPGPTLINVRLMVPSNLGTGNASVEWSDGAWTRVLPDSTPTASCLDCYEMERYAAVINGPWNASVRFVGPSHSFQVFVMAVSFEGVLAVPTSSVLTKFSECLNSQSGCSPPAYQGAFSRPLTGIPST